MSENVIVSKLKILMAELQSRISKKAANCPHYLECIVYKDEPGVVYVVEHNELEGHVVGDMEDVSYLDIPPRVQEEIEKLIEFMTPRQVMRHLQG